MILNVFKLFYIDSIKIRKSGSEDPLILKSNQLRFNNDCGISW